MLRFGGMQREHSLIEKHTPRAIGKNGPIMCTGHGPKARLARNAALLVEAASVFGLYNYKLGDVYRCHRRDVPF